VLDEPTSGLDAFAAANAIELLKNISRERQIAVLMTIHQPSFAVLSLFDKISLLARGAVYYNGPPHIAEAWFESLGYGTPKGVSPPDHYITMAEAFEKTPEAEARVLGLLSAWAERGEAFVASYEKDYPASSSIDGHSPSNTIDAKRDVEQHAGAERDQASWPTPWHKELAILTHRVWLQLIRDKSVLFAGIGQTVALCIFIGFAYFRLGNSQSDVLARVGALL
jgi:ABC-type multidrug transport system ATPase subunit